MLDRLVRFVRGEPANRPFSHLSDEELVDRYTTARARIEGSWSNARDAIVVCNQLMAEWERRHDELVSLENRVQQLEETRQE